MAASRFNPGSDTGSEGGVVIDVVTPDRYNAFRPQLREMHRLRYKVFKERLKWDVHGENGEERDQFDDYRPTYLLWRDRVGRVAACWRFLPTSGPYMLKDVFPVLLEGRQAPRDPKIWEGSRFAVSPDLPREPGLVNPRRITSEMFCGVTEFCIALGIPEIVCVYDVRIARMLPVTRCLPIWQSRPHRLGNTIGVLGCFPMTPAFLDQLRKGGDILGSVIRTAPWLEEERVA